MLRQRLRKLTPAYAAYLRVRIAWDSLRMARAAPLAEGARRFHGYGVGAAKTGTTSLALLFAQRFRAAHEPLSYHFNARWRGRGGADGDGEPRALERYLLRRDRLLKLEMEASHNLLPAVPTLVRLFPAAKFVLTVRDPVPWMESLISEELFTREQRASYLWWEPWFRHTCGAASGHPPEERALADLGVSTVRGYMRYWARHNREVLEAVPDDRLLVLRTDELDSGRARLAQFFGVAPDDLPERRTRANERAAKRVRVGAELPADYVRALAHDECGELRARWFPEAG